MKPIPPYLNALLWRWGNARYSGIDLGYPHAASGFRECISGYGQEPGPTNDEDFDKLCSIIDNQLKRPRQTLLVNRFRKGFRVNESRRHFRLSKEGYEIFFDDTIDMVERLMNE